jgi:exo-1,4-beta-D-glucosaminidase
LLLGVTMAPGLAASATDAGGTAAAATGARSDAGPATTTTLAAGWQIHSAEGLGATGAELSRPGYAGSGWTATAVPSTVLGALVNSGEIEDPYHGKNLEAVPAARFAGPWWYRTELAVAAPLPASSRLVFEGINYSAEVWLNGERIAGRDDLHGAFRVFELDVSGRLRAGANALAVEVFPPVPGDFTIGFVDWDPKPPDRNMGIWRPVSLRTNGGVSLDDVFVRTDLEQPSFATARLTLGARVTNRTDRKLTTTLRGRVGDVDLAHKVTLAPREERQLLLTPAEVPQLLLRAPRLWWPHGMGEPRLYHLELTATLDGRVSDHQALDFGVRQVADYLDADGSRGYIVNGKKVLVRGGGWTDDLLLREDPQKLADQIRYVQQMNLNTIRLEGFWGSTQALFDLADHHGIMVWVGWSCQWEWENYLGAPVDEKFGGVDTEAEIELIDRSLHDQVVRLRNHPSVVVWNLGSDMLPHPTAEKRYRATLAQIDPTRPPLGACSVRTSEVSGPTGVKMNGPYEWVPPNYWYLDKEHGGAFGFNTETGPGAQPPPADSIRRMLPKEHWWPIDDLWSYHCGRGEFGNLDHYVKALDGRYGKAADLDDFARKAQLANYEAMRAMFEAFSLRRPAAKGVVQWMLNSAWPNMFWHLYDWYLVPNGAFYGARDANRPLNLGYDYGERKLVAVNDTSKRLDGVTARVRVYDTASKLLFERAQPLALPAESRVEALVLPAIEAAGNAYFLDARLVGKDGATLARSFYWLSTTPDELDWEKNQWYVTPTKRYADLSALSRMAPAKLEVQHRFETTAEGQVVHVTLANPGNQLAFFVELSVVGDKSGHLAAPVFWDDNYVSLLPGERREIRGTIPAHALAGERPVFRFSGINVRGNQEISR